jgi:hypothetical protein
MQIAMTKSVFRNGFAARGEWCEPLDQRQKTAALEHSAVSRTVHPRYRMVKDVLAEDNQGGTAEKASPLNSAGTFVVQSENLKIDGGRYQ